MEQVVTELGTETSEMEAKLCCLQAMGPKIRLRLPDLTNKNIESKLHLNFRNTMS